MTAFRNALIREKCQYSSGCSCFVAIIKVINFRGIKVYSFFYKVEAKYTAIKVNVLLWIICQGSNMMDACNKCSHSLAIYFMFIVSSRMKIKLQNQQAFIY